MKRHLFIGCIRIQTSVVSGVKSKPTQPVQIDVMTNLIQIEDSKRHVLKSQT